MNSSQDRQANWNRRQRKLQVQKVINRVGMHHATPSTLFNYVLFQMRFELRLKSWRWLCFGAAVRRNDASSRADPADPLVGPQHRIERCNAGLRRCLLYDAIYRGEVILFLLLFSHTEYGGTGDCIWFCERYEYREKPMRLEHEYDDGRCDRHKARWISQTKIFRDGKRSFGETRSAEIHLQGTCYDVPRFM